MILKYPISLDKPEDYDYADDLLCQFQIALKCLQSDQKQVYYPSSLFRALTHHINSFIDIHKFIEIQQKPADFLHDFLMQLRKFHPKVPGLTGFFFEGS